MMERRRNVAATIVHVSGTCSASMMIDDAWIETDDIAYSADCAVHNAGEVVERECSVMVPSHVDSLWTDGHGETVACSGRPLQDEYG
jgi:hypothetical protein